MKMNDIPDSIIMIGETEDESSLIPFYNNSDAGEIYFILNESCSLLPIEQAQIPEGMNIRSLESMNSNNYGAYKKIFDIVENNDGNVEVQIKALNKRISADANYMYRILKSNLKDPVTCTYEKTAISD